MTQQLTLPDTSDLEAQSPRELLEDAYAWVSANRLVWQRAFVDRAYADIDGRVSVKRYIEDARATQDGIARKDGQPFKVKNGYSPAFARFLRAWHPELKDAIPLASSKLDGCRVPERPY